MLTALSALVIAGCLVGTGWTVVLAARDRRATNGLLFELIGVEVLLLLQLVVAVVLLARGERPQSTATFVSYALTVPTLLPAGVIWSQMERSRSSTLVITVAAIGAAVMTGRMLQMWSTVHG